ncbi:MAG: hypothetical protein KA072_08245 [Thermoanaerobaculaceae bacterium]|nr:hypothetical protein [Thermoanaerobaculaceae bacterium]MDI9623020.1 hypothetical protein [Acidobacteriota bacterium]NLH12181.1 hypothetical protein [Holophagae bacterium]HPW54999.1 hypothetical protein [Thermoanaerobaculaceae bacterium]
MHRGFFAVALVLALVVPLVGCASAKPTDWTGHHIDEVIAKLGPAKRIVPQGENKMYVWEVERRMAAPPTIDPATGRTTPSPPAVAYTSVRSFYVGRDGIIISYTWQE